MIVARLPQAPIIYTATLNTRFSDFDSYGHMNAANYVDLVVSSRFTHQMREYGLSAADFAQRGLGFYLSRFEIDYKRSVASSQSKVLIHSWVTEVANPRMFIDFEVWSEAKDQLHERGKLSCVCMALPRNKPCQLPDWVVPYLFQVH